MLINMLNFVVKIASMNCPRCKTELQENIIQGYTENLIVDHCPNCQGTWLDRGEIGPIQKVVEPVFWENRDIPNKDEQYENLYCPSCDEASAMEKIPHPRDKKVILDQCVKCSGIWLDHGEIRAIQQENWFKVIGQLFGN